MPSAFDSGGKGAKSSPLAKGAPARSGSAFGGGSTASSAPASTTKRGFLGRAAEDFKNTITAVPSGLVNLGKDAGIEVGHIAQRAVVPGYVAREEAARKKLSGAQQAEFDRKANPFTQGFKGSFENTGSRLGQGIASLKPGGLKPSQSRLARDYSARPVSSLVEDAANLSIVLGPLAEALGVGAEGAAQGSSRAAAAGNTTRAARLAKVESALRTTQSVARGAEHGANLAASGGDPIFLTTRAAGLIKKGLMSDAVRGSSLGVKASEKAAAFGERRQARQSIADIDAEIAREHDRQGRIVAKQRELLPNPHEVEATALIRQGESKALERLDSLPPAERQKVLEAAFPKGREVTPEAFDLARAYETGTMPAEQRARFAEAIDLAEREQQAPRTAREVAGIGRKEGLLSPEQLGDQPLTPVVEAKVRPLREQAAKAADTATRLRRKADQAADRAATVRSDMADRASERAQFNTLVKPATKRALNTPMESQAVGAANMRAHVLGNVAKSAEGRATRLGAKLANETQAVRSSIEAAPKRFRPALERAAASGTRLRQMASDAERAGDPHSAAYLRSVADDLPKVIDDLTAKGIDPSHLIGGETPAYIGGGGGKKQHFPTLRKTGGERQSRTTNIERSAEGQGRLEAKRAGEAIKNVGAVEFRDRFGKSAGDLGLDLALTGEDLKRAAAQAGYKPFDPGALLEGPQKIDADTVFIRQAMADDFSRWFDDARPGKIVSALHKINRTVSIPILRLSPRWQVGNAVSQALQLTVGGGLSPVDIVRYGREAARLMKENPEQVPARFGHSGQFAGLLSPELDALGNPTRGPRTPVGKLVEKSGHLNDWVDRWGKETVYLAKKARGYSDEAAVRRALEVQVDMRRLSNFERNYVQAVFPYYAWAKHITQLSLRLPLEHPVRIAWTLHLADLYGDDQSQLPEWLKGGIRLGKDRFLNVGSVVNPFGDVTGSPLLSPGGAASALSPAIRLAGAALNFDVARAQPLKRPVGTGPMDPSGKPRLGLISPREFANVAAQSFPQTRLATGLIGTPVSRYPTGDPYLDSAGNTYPTDRTRLNYLGRFLGIPTPEKIDAEEIQASAAENRAKVEKQRQNYLKRKNGKSSTKSSSSRRGSAFSQ